MISSRRTLALGGLENPSYGEIVIFSTIVFSLACILTSGIFLGISLEVKREKFAFRETISESSNVHFDVQELNQSLCEKNRT